MIVFYAKALAQREYFNKLAAVIDEPSIVLRSTPFRWPSFSKFLSIPKDLLAECLYYAEQEYCIEHEGKSPGPIWKIMQTISFHWYYACDYRAIQRLSPRMAVIWNGLKPRRYIFAEIARRKNIPCAFMEHGFLPNTTVCDGKGIHERNSVPRNAMFYRSLPPAPAPQFTPLVARRIKTSKQASGRELPARYIFIPFQVDTDSKMILFSPWIKTMRQLFDEVMALSDRFPEYQFIFKEHPSSHRDYRALHDHVPSNRGFFANEYSTQTLIENAAAVITISSTVGIEAMLFSKKVIVIGQTFYAIPDLTLIARNAGELESALNKLAQFTPDELLRRNFLTYLKDDYLIPGSSTHADEHHRMHMKARLQSLRSAGGSP
jgi:capsular polysaccharide export protein